MRYPAQLYWGITIKHYKPVYKGSLFKATSIVQRKRFFFMGLCSGTCICVVLYLLVVVPLFLKKMLLQITLGCHKELRIGVCIYIYIICCNKSSHRFAVQSPGYASPNCWWISNSASPKKLRYSKQNIPFDTRFHQVVVSDTCCFTPLFHIYFPFLREHSKFHIGFFFNFSTGF